MTPAARKTVPQSSNGGGATPAAREPRSRVSVAEAAEILADRDPVIAVLLRDTGPPRLPRPKGQHFEALARAIVYQQLAGVAAGAIYGRLLTAAGGEIQPERIAALSDEQMRAVGLSRAKVLSLRDLAAKALDGTISLSGRVLARKSDAEVEEQLRSVRGIGPWTAQVFMMFRLRRLDIWPTADLGCAAATASPGASPCRPHGSSNRSAIPTGPTGPSSPGIAGERPSSTVTEGRTSPNDPSEGARLPRADAREGGAARRRDR